MVRAAVMSLGALTPARDWRASANRKNSPESAARQLMGPVLMPAVGASPSFTAGIVGMTCLNGKGPPRLRSGPSIVDRRNDHHDPKGFAEQIL